MIYIVTSIKKAVSALPAHGRRALAFLYCFQSKNAVPEPCCVRVILYVSHKLIVFSFPYKNNRTCLKIVSRISLLSITKLKSVSPRIYSNKIVFRLKPLTQHNRSWFQTYFQHGNGKFDFSFQRRTNSGSAISHVQQFNLIQL